MKKLIYLLLLSPVSIFSQIAGSMDTSFNIIDSGYDVISGTDDVVFCSNIQSDVKVPFIDNIFETIVKHERTNVVFCAKQFIHLFYAYDKKGFGKIEFGAEVATKIDGLEKKVYFNTIKIHYKGNEIRAGIANSFPRRDLLMRTVK